MKKAKILPWHVSPNSSRGSIDPVKLESEYVKQVYDNIADHWSGTRYKAWPKVEKFIQSQPTGTLFADMGCGNGKNLFACNSTGFGIGSDFSYNLAYVAKQNQPSFEVSAMDVLNLPLKSNWFDCSICIAVLHHISTEERRKKLIEECVRIIKPNSQALFYAWAKEQEVDENKGVSGHRFETNDVLVPWHLRNDTITTIKKESVLNTVSHAKEDISKNSVVLQRYCHVYSKDEWNNLFNSVPGIELEDVYWDTGNWAAIVKKQ